MSEASAKRWATRRTKYGERGHGGSYSRWSKDPYGVRALQWVVDMHLEGTLSEGQCCQRLDIDRVAFRKMADARRSVLDSVPHDAVEAEARRLRAIAMKPRPDSDWDVPGKIHEDSKDDWRRIARERLATKTDGEAA